MSRWYPVRRRQYGPVARPLPTQDNINAVKHRCLEWDSNPRYQCSSGRRQFMPQTSLSRKLILVHYYFNLFSPLSNSCAHALGQLRLHNGRKRGYHLDALFLIRVYHCSKILFSGFENCWSSSCSVWQSFSLFDVSCSRKKKDSYLCWMHFGYLWCFRDLDVIRTTLFILITFYDTYY
jgi:hypothetical protein